MFVVSHDGPVTVYSDGMNIAQLRDGPTYASILDSVQLYPDSDHLRRLYCGECERWLDMSGSSG